MDQEPTPTLDLEKAFQDRPFERGQLCQLKSAAHVWMTVLSVTPQLESNVDHASRMGRTSRVPGRDAVTVVWLAADFTLQTAVLPQALLWRKPSNG